MGTNAIKFTGLSSGMDTETIVKALLATQQNKIDTQNKQKTLLEWKKDAWKEMNNKINAFNTKYIDKMKLGATFIQNKVNSSNSNALEINTKSVVPSGTHQVKIDQLATGAYMATQKMTATVKEVTGDTKLSEGTKLSDLVDKDNNPIDFTGKTMFVNVKDKDNEEAILAKKITISDDETIGSLKQKIQAIDKNLNVSFDVTNKRFFISSKITGEESMAKITSDSSDILTALGLEHDTTVTRSDGSATTQGSNAKYTYNGMSMESVTNKVSVNGMEMTLKAVTTEAITIEATTDTEGIVSFVKEFVEAYNALLEDINTKLTTKKSSSYEPLTDEEKESMTDKEIELWETKIKDGLFYRDSSLTTVKDMLRNELGGVVNNGNETYKMLAQIGITTGNWQENGKLYFDEEKFKEALQTKPDEVISLLTGTGDGKEKGIFPKISAQFASLSKSTDFKSYGSFYTDKLDVEKGKEIAKNIIKYQDRYDAMEKAYYAKFTAMEKMMSQLNSQSSAFTSMLG